MTLSLANDDGELARKDISGPGGELRVGVGDPARRSAIWKVWANKSKSDVYVAARGLGATQKWSLHESGDWRFQWTSPEHALRYTGESQRVIDRWSRPREIAGGWTKGISVWVPHGGLSQAPDDPVDVRKPITFIPEPARGHAVGIHVVFASTDQGYVRTGGAIPVDGFWISSGEVVLVLAQQKRLTEKDMAWLRDNHGRAVAMLPTDLSGDSTVRVSMHGQYDDAVRWVWDMGLELTL